MTETYTIPSDFTAGIDIAQLQTEILDSSIATQLIGITRELTLVYIVFVASITAPEKITLDAIVATHVPTVIVDAVPATGALVKFMIVSNPTTPLDNVYTVIASNLWSQTRYYNFNTGRVVFSTTIIDNPLDIQIWNISTASQIGYYQSFASEKSVFNIDTPVADSEIAIRIKKSNIGGTAPTLESITIEFIC